MDKLRKTCYVSSVLVLLMALIALNQGFVGYTQSPNQIIEPRQGDCLRYNYTMIDEFGIAHYGTWNFTFSVPPFTIDIEGQKIEFNETSYPDCIKAQVEMSDWMVEALGFSDIPDELWIVLNTTDQRMLAGIFAGGVMGYVNYFWWIIPTDIWQGKEIPWMENPGTGAFINAKVIDADNLVVHGQQYPVWVVEYLYSRSLSFLKYEASSGVLLSMNTTDPEGVFPEVYTLSLTEAQIGDFAISPPSQYANGTAFWLEWWFLVIIGVIVIIAMVSAFVVLRRMRARQTAH